jgi:hypothetical protein
VYPTDPARRIGENQMPENESQKKSEFYFVQLIITFQAAAMQQMGKLQNPITQKVERNLEQARSSIDILEMLQDKTRNNLTENEKELLEHTLYELRMNYLDEVKKDQQKKEEKDSARKEESREEPSTKETEAKQDMKKQKDEPSDQKEKDSTQPGSDVGKEQKGS